MFLGDRNVVTRIQNPALNKSRVFFAYLPVSHNYRLKMVNTKGDCRMYITFVEYPKI